MSSLDASTATRRAEARRSEALGAALPPLLIAAERIAATVAQGVHGRRRVGLGDSFWQFRPYLSGDSPTRIDWRQSAKSNRAFVRETEWEAAQTLILWRDASPSMRWKSRGASVEKINRAETLLLALAALALRGSERVRLLDGGERATSGASALDRLALALGRPESSTGLPPETVLPRHATLVLMGDFLSPLPELAACLGRLSAIPVSVHLLQILDPAETGLPYSGRIRFRGLEQEGDTLIPRVEAVREAYAEALAQHLQGIAGLCAAAGFSHALHRTDHRPEQALLGLYTALAP